MLVTKWIDEVNIIRSKQAEGDIPSVCFCLSLAVDEHHQTNGNIKWNSWVFIVYICSSRLCVEWML